MQVIFFGILLAILCGANGQSNGPIRLFNKGSTDMKQSSGIVQVYYSSDTVPVNWINVCYGSDDDDINLAANVICHQLGFTNATSYSYAAKQNYGTDASPSLISDPDCSSIDLLVIHQCDYKILNQSCNDSMDLTVVCSTERLEDNAFDTMVRLVDGTTVSEGRAEVYCNGYWGTICDTSEDDSAEFANLICQQLGYTNADTWDEAKLPGTSSQRIWMKDVVCSADTRYECVATCKTCPVGVDNTISSCDHSTDMTIRCVTDNTQPPSTDDTMYGIDTCRHVNDLVQLATAIVIAIVLVSLFCCAVCIVLVVTIPLCICCCLGVGIGAKSRTKINKPTNYANFD